MGGRGCGCGDDEFFFANLGFEHLRFADLGLCLDHDRFDDFTLLVNHFDDRLLDDHLDVDTFLAGLDDDLFDDLSGVVNEFDNGLDFGDLNFGVELIGRLDEDPL